MQVSSEGHREQLTASLSPQPRQQCCSWEPLCVHSQSHVETWVSGAERAGRGEEETQQHCAGSWC